MRKTTILITVLVLTGSNAAICQNTENKKELEKVSREIREKQESQYKLFEEEKNVLFQMQKFDKKLEELKGNLESYDKKLGQYRKDVSYSKEQLKNETAKLKKVEEDLKIRLRELYKEGSFKNLKLLLAAADYEEFSKKYEILVAIARKDVELKSSIYKRKGEISGKKNEFERRIDRVEYYKNWAAKNEESIKSEKGKKNEVLKDIKDKKAVYEQAVAELKLQSGKLEEMIKEYDSKFKKVELSGQENDISASKGKLEKPALGKVVSYFGKFKHPKFNVYVHNNGIEISAKLNDPVASIYSGVVLFADWFKGYGKTVLIDHGDNVVCVYGHLSEISVNFGQKVEKGSRIGSVGDTGSLDMPSLYFEVRKNGSPENPLEWLKK
ncbi:MAG: peptidoglycan DD-metalloendopeptidase family protein [Candidatus Firestonebacteria bacterium]